MKKLSLIGIINECILEQHLEDTFMGWITPDNHIIKVYDHFAHIISYVKDKINMDDHTREEVYEAAFDLGWVRFASFPNHDGTNDLMIQYNHSDRIKHVIKKILKNFINKNTKIIIEISHHNNLYIDLSKPSGAIKLNNFLYDRPTK